MANGNDHRPASDPGIQQHRSGRLPARGEDVPQAPARRILDIVLWSSITNVTLLACFVAGWNFDALKVRFLPTVEIAAAAAAGQVPPPARSDLQDNELLTKGPQRQLKGPLQITTVASSQPEVPEATVDEPTTETAPEETAVADGGTFEQDQGDGAGDMTVGPEDPSAQLVRSPVLRKGQKSGDVAIGSFATVSLPGSSEECLDTAYSLLEDAGAGRDKLRVLAESKMITVARICADNGSLVVTCRMDQITISPRRLKPNETCTG